MGIFPTHRLNKNYPRVTSLIVKKYDAKKKILLQKIEDGERGNFVTLRVEGKIPYARAQLRTKEGGF